MTFAERLLAELPDDLLEQELPCDVRVPEATTIAAGCKLRTLIEAIGHREELNVRHFREAGR